MRVGSVLEEARRNILAGATRAALLAFVWSALLAVLVAADASMINGLLVRAHDFRTSGAATMVVTAPGRIDAAACERLEDRDAVASAGALRAVTAALAPLSAPGLPVPTFEATRGLVDQLGAAVGGGVLMSEDAATALGLMPGDALPLRGATAQISDVFPYPHDGRRAGLGYSVVLPVPTTGLFDECWATSWPVDEQLPGLLTSVVVVDPADSDAATPVVAQLNSARGAALDGEALFRSRSTAALPWLAAVAGLLLGFASVWARRLELASARHIGVSIRDQTGQLAVESLAWGLPGSVVGMLAAPVVVPDAAAAEPIAVAASALLIVVVGCAAALGGVLAALAFVSERRFVRYHRARS